MYEEACIIARISYKTSDHSDCFIFQMFQVQLFPIFLFEYETKSKFFIWTFSQQKEKGKNTMFLNEILNIHICRMMIRLTYRQNLKVNLW